MLLKFKKTWNQLQCSSEIKAWKGLQLLCKMWKSTEQVIKGSIIELEIHLEQSDQIRSGCNDQI